MHQRDVVKHVRTQAAVVASFSLIVARFLSPEFGDERISMDNDTDIIAGLLFLGSLAFALGAALMRPVWNFYLTEDQALQVIDFEKRVDLDKTEMDILKCQILYQHVKSNTHEINRVNFQLSSAMALAVLQIVFWLM